MNKTIGYWIKAGIGLTIGIMLTLFIAAGIIVTLHETAQKHRIEQLNAEAGKRAKQIAEQIREQQREQQDAIAKAESQAQAQQQKLQQDIMNKLKSGECTTADGLNINCKTMKCSIPDGKTMTCTTGRSAEEIWDEAVKQTQ